MASFLCCQKVSAGTFVLANSETTVAFKPTQIQVEYSEKIVVSFSVPSCTHMKFKNARRGTQLVFYCPSPLLFAITTRQRLHREY